MKKILVIQTAFIGDVILATSVVEKLAAFYPDASIDFLLRKGNESLLENNPHLHSVLVWNKKKNKIRNLVSLIMQVRHNRYDVLINLHRFSSSGIITMLSGASYKSGFDKNPFAFTYSKKIRHEIGNGMHETERNQQLIKDLTDNTTLRPKLYPSEKDYKIAFGLVADHNYITVSPASVWYTKQLPAHKWIELLKSIDNSTQIFFLGAGSDKELCSSIADQLHGKATKNFAGQLSFLQSAALMKSAKMNYVNDSAPCHIASAMNAPVTEIFCSTVPEFGFGPLSDQSVIVQTSEDLECRPCGLHGFKACPKGHFKCATLIDFTIA